MANVVDSQDNLCSTKLKKCLASILIKICSFKKNSKKNILYEGNKDYLPRVSKLLDRNGFSGTLIKK